jgi:peroxiredoxin
LNVRIAGCSFDETYENAAFHDDNNFPYPLWSDSNRDLAVYYGAASSVEQKNADRVTVVLDPEGRWILSYEVELFGFKAHPGEVLSDLQAILAP